ncbi:hypothetical protein M0805_000169 [Coniferiporia weirii]|nr:hypothetical protein M0805_000169 [Coniferiporia weirii]
MKFFAVLLSLAAATLAQRVTISTPAANQTLTAGQNITVSVAKFDSLTGSTEVGIAITLEHCSQTPCEDASERLGDILYAGAYNPQRGPGNEGQPAQNFTVAIPAGFPTGPAVISVPHANLLGAGPFFFTEIQNVTVVIA